ncbi:UDP-glucose 4-epimerase 5, partial [Allomyces arbusculus]
MVASPAGSAPWSAPALTSSAAVVAGITHSLLLTLQLAASPDEPNYFAAPGAPAPATPAVRWPEALTLATANLATLATVQFATHRWTGARGPWPGASSRMQSFGVAACVATAALAYHVALTTVHPSIVFLVGLLALQSTCAKSSSKYHHVADHDDKDEHWTAHAASDVAYPAWTRWALVLSTVILVAVYWPVHPIQAAVSLSVLIFSILATPYFASRANHDRDVAPTPLVTAAVLLVLPLFGTGIPASLPVGHLAATALAAAVATASPSSTLPHALSVPAVVTAAWSAPFASAPIARAALAVALTLVVAATTRSRLEPATAPSSSPRDQIPLSDAADAVVDADSDSIDTLPRPATASRLASTPVVPLLAAAVLAFAAFVLLGLTASVVPTTAPGDYRAVIRPAARDPCADLSFTRKEPVPVVNATTALVTGGSGFIGSHLVEKLLALGYKVRILDNLATGYLHNIAHLVTHANVEFVYGDIMDQDTILQAVQGVDYVYHLAAMSK